MLKVSTLQLSKYSLQHDLCSHAVLEANLMRELLRHHCGKDDVLFDHIGCIPGWNRVHSQQLQATDKGRVLGENSATMQLLYKH